MNSGKVVIGTELDTKKFDAQIEDIKRNLEDIETILSDTKGMDVDEISKYNAEAEKLRNRLADLVKKRDELNNPPSQLLEWSKDFGKSLKDSVTRIGRLIIGIFGIRTAYNAVRNAMSVITENDQQLKADIDYMKNVLAYMLEPVVRAIVGWFKQLMFYVGYIAKAWFGVNIYAKANQKAMDSMAGSSGAIADNLKEAKKQLAGFDEMNTLQDNTSGGGGGGGTGGGVSTPSFDLGDFQDMPVPGWLKWIEEHGDTVIAILAGITAGLLALKLGFTALQALGIGTAVAGIVYMAEKILEYLKDPTWESFGGIVEGIGIAVLGLGIAIGNLPAIIAGVAILIVGIVLKHWGEIESFLDEKIKWLEDCITDVRNVFGDKIGDIYEIAVYAIGSLWKSIKQFVTGVRETFDGIIMFIRGIFTKDWNTALDGLTKAFSGFTKTIGALWDILWGNLKKVASKIGTTIGENMVGTIKSAINGVLWLIEERINGAIDLINGSIKLINKIPGVSVGKVSRLSLPRLARGGIVNNPGQGVMMGNYIAGERGAEAVLPLTDDTLQRLANMIPITVNLTNTMNGRVISRELQKVQNENNFAFNR